MRLNGVPRRTIEPAADGASVVVLDQTLLPFGVDWRRLASLAEAADAIRTMVVRGAPLIGVTAAYGVALALRGDPSDRGLAAAATTLCATRPTAVNLRTAVERVRRHVAPLPPRERAAAAWSEAAAMADEDVEANAAIGRHGLALLRTVHGRTGGPVRVLTHCNAGWLATVDGGTALAPVYAAFDAGVPVHVFVDETRPRNQGARLTAFELAEHGVPLTLLADNAGGHLLQRGRIDLCLVGADRVAADGAVANKIGTYLKALAAKDAGVPFYVAVPASTIDLACDEGLRDIPIEDRGPAEVLHVEGVDEEGAPRVVRVAPADVAAENPAFDVTPARLVTALVTDRGVVEPARDALRTAFGPGREARA